MIDMFSSQLITLQEMARFILRETDGNEKMLHWLQAIYPCATSLDADKEKELMGMLLEVKSYSAGRDAINRLSLFHKNLAYRDIKHCESKGEM